ncbi:UbiD family decarboxylase [Polaromonas sp. P1(28)-13]|nr:UbiD family decarboxylase [Polaromonas sp. P1(28)-13]
MPTAPWQENVYTKDFDIGKLLPVLRHAENDPGRFITASVVVFHDPETGIYNASYHRLQLLGPNKTALKMDYGRHLRLAYERAAARGEDLPIAVCIGTDLSVLYTAATMGSANARECRRAQGGGWPDRRGAAGLQGHYPGSDDSGGDRNCSRRRVASRRLRT